MAMPEIRYYEVEQTRMIKVQANNELDAAAVAIASFDTDGKIDVLAFSDNRQGRTLGQIVVTNVNISREKL